MRAFFPAFCAVLFLSGLLLLWALWQGQAMREGGEELAATRLPELSQLYQVKLSGEALERELTAYLRAGDRSDFLVRRERIGQELREAAGFLAALPQDHGEVELQARTEALMQLSRQVDEQLGAGEDAAGEAPAARAAPVGAVISTSVSSSVEADVEEVFRELKKRDRELPIILTTLIKDHEWVPSLFSSVVRDATRFVAVEAEGTFPSRLSRQDVPVLEKGLLSDHPDRVAELFRRHFRV